MLSFLTFKKWLYRIPLYNLPSFLYPPVRGGHLELSCRAALSILVTSVVPTGIRCYKKGVAEWASVQRVPLNSFPERSPSPTLPTVVESSLALACVQ